MADFPFDIVGFDLDGTLLDTSAGIAAAVNHALALAGRDAITVAQVLPMVGAGMRRTLANALAVSGGCDEVELDRLFPIMFDYYAAHGAAGSHPYPGMAAALDALAARGVTLAVVTNKAEALALAVLGELGLIGRFAGVIGGDTLEPGNAKPSPVPIREMIARCGGGRAAFVGDSLFDTQAARAAGIPSIAVSFGFLTGPVEALGADAAIDHFDALVPALERLGAA